MTDERDEGGRDDDPGADREAAAGPAAGPILPAGPRDQIGFDGLPPPPARREAADVSPPPQPADGADGTDSQPESGRMGLLDHLEELRKVLFHSLLATFAAAALCWFKSGQLLDLIIRPMGDQGVYFMAPGAAFMARLKVALGCGLFAVAPFVLFRVYGFVLPGLHHRERRVTTPVLVWTVLLFYLGAAMAWFGYPFMLRVMLGMGTDSVKPMIEVGAYLGSFVQFLLCCGLMFELPIVIVALCAAGIVSPRWLVGKWRYVMVIVAIVAAAVTPDANVVNQALMMVPVLVLYWSSVVVALVVVRRRDRRQAAAAAEGD